MRSTDVRLLSLLQFGGLATIGTCPGIYLFNQGGVKNRELEMQLIGAAILSQESELTVYETMDETGANLTLTTASGIYTQTEQTMASEA